LVWHANNYRPTTKQINNMKDLLEITKEILEEDNLLLPIINHKDFKGMVNFRTGLYEGMDFWRGWVEKRNEIIRKLKI